MLVTMDVVALYPSIPIADGIAAVLRKLSLHQEDIDMLGPSLDNIESLLSADASLHSFSPLEAAWHRKLQSA